MTDLTIENRKAIASQMLSEIDSYCVATYNDGHRWHLGASKIGDVCRRRLWYGYRWVEESTADGRQQRLFNRGHREEDRYYEWLTGIGFKVHRYESSPVWDMGLDGNPFISIKGKQYRIRSVNGHYGGSLDSIIEFPERYNIPIPMLGEFKTNGTGTGFSKLFEKGLKVHKPEHYRQSSAYGLPYGLEYVAYFNINKNDDDLYIEIEKLDPDLAKQMEEKAASVIYSQEAPPRFSENANHVECKSFCQFKDICHYNKPVEKNCRSCINCHPVDNAEFACLVNGDAVIPRDVVRIGCDQWSSISKTPAKVIAISPVKANDGMFEIENVPVPT